MKTDRSFDDILRVDFSVSAKQDWDEGGMNLIRRIGGEIIFTDDREKEHTVGQMYLEWIQIGNMVNHGFNAWDACDAHSQEAENAYSTVYDIDGQVRPQIEESYGLYDFTRLDLLLLENITVERRYRGRGYGRWAILQAMEMFGSDCRLIVLKPFPLQFNEWLSRLKKGKRIEIKEVEAAFNKLRRYYAGIGFRPLPTDDDFWAYCPALKRQPAVKIPRWKAKLPSGVKADEKR